MNRFLIPLIVLILVGMQSVGCSAQKKGKASKSDKSLPIGTWKHSHEEDQNSSSDWKTYRQSSFDFPPARGRNGFILQEDHKIALLQPSPNDMRDTIWGTWAETKLQGSLSLSFPKTPVSHFEATKKSADVWQVKMW